jgi:hypothetical protein
MLDCYLDFCCTGYYSIHLYYCNATNGLNYEVKTITTFEFPKSNYSMHVTKDITGTKTEVNISNVQMRSMAARYLLCQVFNKIFV